MMWKQGTLYAFVAGGEDELGNAIKEKVTLWSGQLRFTPWTDEDIAVNGREVTQDEQRFILPVLYETVKNAEQVELDGVLLNITAVSDLSPRWTMIQVRVYKR